tara:strand:- start:101 stop:433 length:333 start_codon:yes stop_codon:yes gene_type:complete
MRVTRNQLRRIIKEELGRTLLERDPFADLDAAVGRKEGKPQEAPTQERAEEFVEKWIKAGKPRAGSRDVDELFTEFGVVKHARGTTGDPPRQAHRVVFNSGDSFIVEAEH